MKKIITGIFFLLVATSVFAQIPTNGLIGYWPFNGNANDESGRGNHGTVVGAKLTADRFGKPNSAYQFDGNGDYINSNFNFNGAQSSFTIVYWIKLDSLYNYSFSKIFHLQEGITYEVNNDFLAQYKQINFFLNGITYANTPINKNVWYNVVCTFDFPTKTKKLYVNGVLDLSVVSQDVITRLPNSTLRIGARLNNVNNYEYYHGIIDDLIIYNRVITPQEVTQIYSGCTNFTRINLGQDIANCSGGPVVLNAGTGFSNYLWSNNATSPQITVNTSGTYSIRVTDFCNNVSRDTITIKISTPVAKSQSFALCSGDSIRVGNKYYKTLGTFKDTLKSSAGCDSILTTTITQATNCANTISGVINKYSPVTSFTCDKVVVENGTLFSAGDRVLIIQMKGARVDTSNTANFGAILDYRSAGNYEFNTVKSVSGNTITLQFALKKSYETTGNVQLVYVPVYTDVTVGGKITGTPWDGKKGGVIAMEVSGTLTLNADIDASGIGFRGGPRITSSFPPPYCVPNTIFAPLLNPNGGHKGEGIAKWDSLKILNKGAWANGGGGGNNHNAGGGGGANAGNGGRGGKIYSDVNLQTCLGGHGLPGNKIIQNTNKLFLGGGGGAGHENDNVGSAGGNGGGLIIINATAVTGNGKKMISNGSTALNTRNDGAGGGGAGGTIAVQVNALANIFFEAIGGNGGNNQWQQPEQCVAPGGGGGGGLIFSNQNIDTSFIKVSNGLAGKITAPTSGCYNSNFEAENGAIGTSLRSLQLAYSDKIQASNIDSTSTNIALCNNENYTLPDGIITNQPGLYRNILQNIAGCDSIIIKTNLSYDFKPSFSLGNDTVLCLGTEITLNPGVNGDYTWQDGSNANVYEAIVPGVYSLSVSNECGSTSDTISFQGIDCNCFVFIPNAFSPNNDGKNDNLIIKETGIASSTIIIYSKWGEEVFSTNNNERQWDGTVDGKSPQPDVYGYYYRGVCLSGEIIIRKGDITIVK